MAIYRVLLDGVDIYDPTSKGMVLIDPVVHTEAGAAGNFEFTMPPMHVFYNSVTPYGSSIEVLEDGQSIFFGRPLKPKIGFYNQKTYHCEGALAFLNDSRPTNSFSFDDITPIQYFRDLISYHNSLQSNVNRRFTVGNITVTVDWDVYREMTPSMTIMEHIKRGCIGSDGGYLFTRRVNGVNYIDWVKDMPYTCNQTVEFALNLLDMSRSGNEDIYTGVVLQGGERKVKKDNKTFHSIVRYGPLWGSQEAIAKYGEILGYQEYPDITNVDDLIAAGAAFLSSQQFESMLFEVSAAEQHYLNASLNIFKSGQKVHLVSNPHFVDMMLPVQSVDVRLDSAEKKVTLGTQKKQTLTKIQKKIEEKQENDVLNVDDLIDTINDIQTTIDDMQTEIDDIIANQGVITGDNGNPYDIGVNTGGDVYAEEHAVLERIEFTDVPFIVYNEGDTFSLTGYVVTGFYNTGATADVTAQCTFSPADGTVLTDEDTLTATLGGLEATTKLHYVYWIKKSSLGVMDRANNTGHRIQFISGNGYLTYDVPTDETRWSAVFASAYEGSVVQRTIYDKNGKETISSQKHLTSTKEIDGKRVYYTIDAATSSSPIIYLAPISIRKERTLPTSDLAWLMIYGEEAENV